jgi:hypothetical protein
MESIPPAPPAIVVVSHDDAVAAAESAAEAEYWAGVAQSPQYPPGGQPGEYVTPQAGGAFGWFDPSTTYGLKPANGARSIGQGELLLLADHAANVHGDGVTEDTGLVQLMSTARAYGAMVRFTPGKTYVTSAPLNPTGCTLDMRGATLQAVTGVAAPNLLQPTGAFTLIGGTLDTTTGVDPGVSTQGAGVYLAGAAGWTEPVLIQGTTVRAHQTGIRLFSTTTINDPANAAPGATLIDSVVITRATVGIDSRNLAGVIVRGCNISGVTGSGIYARQCRGWKAIGNTITAGGHGIVFISMLDPVVAENIVTSCGQSGICLGGDSTLVTATSNPVIANNVCRGNTDSGITCDPSRTGQSGIPVPTYGAVVGNTCAGNGIHGIVLTNAQHMAATGNQCHHNTSAGISPSTADTVVQGNHCTANGTYGLAYFYNAAAQYGRHRIGVNYLDGNTSGQLLVAAGVFDVTFPPGRRLIKTADQTLPQSSSTLVAVTDLSTTVEPGTYLVEGSVIYDASTTADISVAWNRPTGTTGDWTPNGLISTTSTGSGSISKNNATSLGTGLTLGGIGVGARVTMSPVGRFVVTTTGTLGLTAAQNNPEATDVTIRAGSWLLVTRIG